MREIKFRAWVNILDGPFMTYEITDLTWEFGRVTQVFAAHSWHFECYSTKEPDFILLQSTGLKDKNGKEIYEGDILIHESSPDRPFLLQWEMETWCEDGFYTGFFLENGSNCYEIIGNIYENPELIK